MPRYALVIGISQYQSLTSLPNAARDAEAVAQVLERHGNFDVVRRFPDRWKAAENCYEIAERTISAAELIDKIKNFLEQAQQGEGLIYYTGHGVTQTDPDTDERSGFLATSDYSPQQPGLSLHKFNVLIGKSQLSSLMVFLDCCHSGYFLEHNLLRQKLTSFNTSGDYYIVTASRQSEEAFYGEEHSVFTEALLKGLDRKNADINGDISGDRLFDYVGRTLRQSGQEPLRMGWGRYITLLRYPPLEPIPAEHPFQTANPYRGLYTFEPEHADYFCGREETVRNLTIQLLESQVLTVIGPSGCGKSSLLRAGLLPELARDRLPGSSQWSTRLVMPSTHSFSEIAGLIAELTRSPQPYVLLIDQFEEIFTHWSQDSDRQRLLRLLADEVTREGSQARVIIAIRGDFLDRCATYPESATLVNRTQPSAYMVTPMTLAELHQAIARPAALHGVQFEEGLINAIAQDVLGQPGALPLLQYALKELWQVCIEQAESPTGQLTAEKYHDIGKVQGALNRRATILYRSFSEDDQALVRCLFKELVQIGDDNETVTRRRVSWARLRAIAPEERIEQMVCLLADQQQRLIIADEEWVQVAHEALLSEWDLLRSWITEDRDDIRLQRLLETDCHVWQTRFGESEEALLSGARLAKIAEWIERTQPRLLPEEEQFVQRSLAKRDRDLQAQLEQERQLREIAEAKAIAELERANEAEARALAETAAAQSAIATAQAEIKRRQTTLRAGALVITLILVLAGTIIQSIQKISRKNLEVAIEYLIASAEASRQVNDQFAALQQGKKALDLLVKLDGPSAPTPKKLLDTLSGIREFKRFSYGSVPTEIAVSPNQQYLLVGGVEGDVKVWQISSDSESQPIYVFKNHQNQNKEATTVDAIDISRDNQLVASGDTDGKIWVWALQKNKSDHSAPQQLSREGELVVALKFLDQSNLIAIRRNGVVENWKMNSNKKFIKLNQKNFSIPILKQKIYGSGNYLTDADFNYSSDIFAGGDLLGRLYVCRLTTQTCSSPDKAYGTREKPDFVRKLSFSEEGSQLVSIHKSNTVRVWKLTNLDVVAEKELDQEYGSGYLSVSPKHSKLIFANAINQIYYFDDTDRNFQYRQSITELSFKITDLKVIENEYLSIISATEDGQVRFWSSKKLGGFFNEEFTSNSHLIKLYFEFLNTDALITQK